MEERCQHPQVQGGQPASLGGDGGSGGGEGDEGEEEEAEEGEGAGGLVGEQEGGPG